MCLRDKLETHRLYSYKDEAGAISGAGMRNVNDWLVDNFGSYWRDDNPRADIEPVWLTAAGTFPKRLSSYLYKNYNLKLVPEQVRRVGDIVKPYVGTGRLFHYDFDNELDWYAGRFGDGGSCFWSDRRPALRSLHYHNSYAIRFWEGEIRAGSLTDSDNFKGKGWGRAWIVFPRRGDTLKPPVPLEKKEMFAILFNSYPKGFLRATAGRVLAEHLGLGYKEIALRFRGSDESIIWVNGRDTEREEHGDYGGGCLIGEAGDIADVTLADLSWYEDEDEDYEEDE